MYKLCKNDLMSGDIVRTRNGLMYFVVGDSLICKDGYIVLGDYDNDLLHKLRHDCDIVAMYRVQPYEQIRAFENGCAEFVPVYQREEAREMTVAEIEEILGYKIKVVEK